MVPTSVARGTRRSYIAHVDRIADVYLGRAGDSRSQDLARARITWIIDRIDVGPVLEVGCSQGIVSVLAAEKGLDVTGVDVEPELLEVARELAASRLAPGSGRVDFRVGDAYALDFADDVFATVVFTETIEHLDDPGRALEELHRVLRPGGRLVLTTPLGYMYDPEHVQVFLPETLSDLVARQFHIEELTNVDHYLALVASAASPPPGSVTPELLAGCWIGAGAVLVDTQQKLHASKREVARITARLREVLKKRDAWSEQMKHLKRLERSHLAPYELRVRSWLGRVRSRITSR